MEGGFRLGQLVESIAGRDRGKHYLVLQRLSDRRWAVANGRDRKLNLPKIKNAKHLLPLDRVAEDVESRLIRGEAVTDHEIDRILEGYGV